MGRYAPFWQSKNQHNKHARALGSKVARQRGGAVRTILLLLVGLSFVGLLAVGGGGYLAYSQVKKTGPLESDAIVLLTPGSSVKKIARQLEQEGVIRRAELFEAVVRVKRLQNTMKAGEYAIPAGASVLDVIDILVEGKSIQYTITLAEGLTTAQILALVVEAPHLTGEIELEVGEGVLLPETYSYTRGEAREKILRRMISAQEKLMNDLWDKRASELPFSTRAEAIILASIVEKETGLASERERVAAVFVNRLKRGMRLQSDPTIIYGLTKGEPLGRGIRQSELRRATPYNTYVINGLPPTPIANPGAASIAAVLNPADTDDLFFVADGSGGHAFAKTLREHERNVAHWRRVERQRKQ